MTQRIQNYLPNSWYITEEQFAIEREILRHKDMPKYLGHASLFAQKGDYYVLPHTHNEKVLIQGAENITLLSNVCLHRQAQLLHGRGNSKSIICPVHTWKYGLDGQVKSSHHIEVDQCLKLENSPTYNWNGLLFDQDMSLHLGESAPIKLPFNYKFGSAETLQADYNWKIFMETYLDLYHIQSIHPGLRGFADCADVNWVINYQTSAQRVGVRFATSDILSPSYHKLATTLAKLPGHESQMSITWASINPNIMIEIYPFNLVVSIVNPTSADATQNYVEFLYADILENLPNGMDLHHEFKASYLETAKEDDAACALMQKGRKALYMQGKEQHGPFHNPLEMGLPSFYEYWLNEVEKYKQRSQYQVA